VFDNASSRKLAPSGDTEDRRDGTEDARIALRCNRKELQLVDSVVANGEFESRSELMRAALHAFLRSRAMSTPPTPPVDAQGLIEVPVRLRQDEYAVFEAYARHIANGQPARDFLAVLIRLGESELKVHELVARARATVREAVENRAQAGALQESAKDLERRGVVGR
jgi:Arc/MetJ-type ribon-helix-helix transcriptional regulator